MYSAPRAAAEPDNLQRAPPDHTGRGEAELLAAAGQAVVRGLVPGEL